MSRFIRKVMRRFWLAEQTLNWYSAIRCGRGIGDDAIERVADDRLHGGSDGDWCMAVISITGQRRVDVRTNWPPRECRRGVAGSPRQEKGAQNPMSLVRRTVTSAALKIYNLHAPRCWDALG